MNRRFSPAFVLACGAVFVAGCAGVPVRSVAPVALAPFSTDTTAAPAVAIEPTAVDLAPLLRSAIARAEIPGAAALVLRGDRVIARGVAGLRRAGGGEPIGAEDKFELCSAAKAMTAAVVARVIEAGKLQWGTPLADVFADTLPQIDPAWCGITVEQALAHRAGLRDDMVSFARLVLGSRGTTSEQRRELARRILSRPPPRPPNSEFHYTSADYLLVAAALEKVTGRSWEELMTEHLFVPLGATSGGFGPPGTPGTVDQPWGHGARWFLYLPLPGTETSWSPGHRQADYPAVAAPAGLVHMSMLDWGRFVSAQLRSHPENPHRATVPWLSAASFERLQQGGGDPYSGGWFTGTRAWAKGARPGDKGRVLFHQGDNGRWNTVVYVAPEIDFAVLVACNRGRMWKPVDEITGALVAKFAKVTKPAAELPEGSEPHVR